MTQAETVSRAMIGFLMMAFALLLMADPAFAQAMGGAGNYSCSGGHATGHLYDSDASCPTTISMDHLFSFLICNMEQLSSNLMGEMYCGMVTGMMPIVMGCLTLAVTFFGAGFMLGIIPATARDFQMFLLKVAFITIFATQADYLVGFGYKFLVTGIRDGVAVGLSGLYPSSATGTVSGAQVYEYLDKFLGRVIEIGTESVGVKWTDDDTTNPCKDAVFGVLAIMAVAFPPLFYLSLMIIVKIALTFLRAVFGYVYAIVGIAFLMTLAPIFLSFYLFTATRNFFDKWIGYLVSFTLQMVILFAFLAFILSIDVRNITSSFVDIIMPVQEQKETTSFRMPWKYCTLCNFEAYNVQSNTVIAPDDYKGFIGEGALRCKTPKEPIKALDAVSPANGKVPDKIIQSALLKFVGTALLSLLVLAYLVDGLLRYVASLAQFLAGAMGASYAPQLGGGESPRRVPTTDMPGSGFLNDFEDGFNDGFISRKNSVGGAVEGLKQGMARMVGGTKTATGETQGGVQGRFLDFLTDPNRLAADE